MKATTQASGATIDQLTYDDVVNKTFTKIDDHPTRKNRDNLLVEVEKILVCVSVPGFDWHRKCGLLGKTRGGEGYTALSGIDYEGPINDEPAATCRYIKKKWSEAKKEWKKEKWDAYKTSCYTRITACKAVCHNICKALDENYYEQLEDELMGYEDVTIREYFEHLDAKWCKMDTKTRKKMKVEFSEPWDQVMHISKFGMKLSKHQE